MTGADQLGIAVVGCGYWGLNHIRVFSELRGARVVAACDQRPERLGEVGRRFAGMLLTADLEEVVAHAEVDAVVVCTEASSHHQIARRCLRAGRHVLVEKPIATSAAEADDLTRAAQSAGVVLMVGHTFLFNAGIRKVKEVVDATPGRIYYLHASRTNLGPIRRDVNAVWDLATHDIAIFSYLLGRRPGWVSAVGSRVLQNQREDVGFVSLGYGDAILGHIHVSWADPNKAREVVVVTSERRIVFNDLNGLEQVRVFEKGVQPAQPETIGFGESQFQIRDGDIVSPRVEISEPLKNQSMHFLDCVRSGRRCLSGGREGREVVEVLEAIDRSLALGGARVEVGGRDAHVRTTRTRVRAVR